MTAVVEKSQHAEVPLTLAEAPPKTLGVLDQGAFWANLGVSLLGFSGAVSLIAPSTSLPALTFAAAIAAAVVGSLIGTAMVGLAAVPGARTGAPSMVLLRGLFGARLSYVPTVLNIVQMLGWGTFELVVIAGGAEAIFGDALPRWAWVVLAGVITTALTIRPLGAVRILRRYVTAGVVVAMVVLSIAVFSRGPSLPTGSWTGFPAAVDYVIALSVSWVPVAADYARHSRSSRAAFAGAVGGYTIAQVACLVLGVGALALVGNDANKVWDPFVTPLWLGIFFGVLVLREVDQSFANVYSAAVSVQNLRPLADRRVLSVVIGLITTVLAITVTLDDYMAFLAMIGSVFVPMFAVLVVDYFLLSGRTRWNTSATAPSRPLMLLPWLLGFAAYWLITPPSAISWWASVWNGARDLIGFTPRPWMSAALAAFLVAGLVTLLLAPFRRASAGSVKED
ncbi:purine-cytosine permease family protein [Bailinhaonella thermotolerans]|uniref:Allantoin permease n=1 Tax=Bailinhaonella thermotolerans TaxID=1070861 RepID=A0A3A4AUA9_9ACTN|nr:cytosine permease [Bailinhaonella thermotolerans]RJL32209.1 allantoin permease [Bailinhaonella thermotolerans]